MTNDWAALGDGASRVAVYGRAADRYITLHSDPRRFCVLRQIRNDMPAVWSNQQPVVATKRRFICVRAPRRIESNRKLSDFRLPSMVISPRDNGDVQVFFLIPSENRDEPVAVKLIRANRPIKFPRISVSDRYHRSLRDFLEPRVSPFRGTTSVLAINACKPLAGNDNIAGSTCLENTTLSSAAVFPF